MMSSNSTPVHIVINPAAGQGRAQEFVEKNVIPLLDALSISHDTYITTAPKDAGRIGALILNRSKPENQKGFEPPVNRVIVVGGDGTTHEMIEGILEAIRREDGGRLGKWEFAILPLGTANALYSSLFPAGTTLTYPRHIAPHLPTDPEITQSLHSLIHLLSSAPPRPLPISLTNLSSPSATSSETSHLPIPAHIVLSTSLHANLLKTSEELRTSHPGLERFKLAAERNIRIFFNANLRLLPPAGGAVKQYNPSTKTFVEPYTQPSNHTTTIDGISPGVTDGTELDGPFSYFLAVTTVDRLEPTFRIAPTITANPPDPANPTMDVIVLRPMRDPKVRAAKEQDRGEVWAARAWEVIGGAYRDGAHLEFRYTAENGGDGEVAVECFRVGGFEWTPKDPEHSPSHVLCADGSMYDIPPGGKAVVSLMEQKAGEGFWVHG